MDTAQCLPPGWRLEVLCPSPRRRDCCLRLTTPSGTEITFTHRPTLLACELTKELAMALRVHRANLSGGGFRIARPDQVGAEPYPGRRR